MKALFADISERERQHAKHAAAFRRDERRRVSGLYDAVQVALAEGDHDRVTLLLQEMRSMVNAAFARRKRVPGPIRPWPTWNNPAGEVVS